MAFHLQTGGEEEESRRREICTRRVPHVRGFTAGCSKLPPCVSDHQVWAGWEGGQGYASLQSTLSSRGSEKEDPVPQSLGCHGAEDWVAWMTREWRRLIWYSRGRHRLPALPNSRLTTSLERTGEGLEREGERRKRGRDFGPNCTLGAASVRGEGWRLMAMLPKVGPFQEAQST